MVTKREFQRIAANQSAKYKAIVLFTEDLSEKQIFWTFY